MCDVIQYLLWNNSLRPVQNTVKMIREMRTGVWFLLLIVVVSSSAEAAITFNGAKCGTKLCRVDEFCSKYDTQCEKCSTICDESTHNFDKELCTRECQGKRLISDRILVFLNNSLLSFRLPARHSICAVRKQQR